MEELYQAKSHRVEQLELNYRNFCAQQLQVKKIGNFFLRWVNQKKEKYN